MGLALVCNFSFAVEGGIHAGFDLRLILLHAGKYTAAACPISAQCRCLFIGLLAIEPIHPSQCRGVRRDGCGGSKPSCASPPLRTEPDRFHGACQIGGSEYLAWPSWPHEPKGSGGEAVRANTEPQAVPQTTQAHDQ